MIFEKTSALDVPTQALRAEFVTAARAGTAHDDLARQVPAFTQVEVGGTAPNAPLGLPLRVAAWNLERCLFPEPSAQALAGADVLLLSEMDCGMARTAQRHTTADIGQALGMAYAYGLEFLELGLGSEIEHSFCTDTFNTHGFHGNALLARAPLNHAFVLRLPGQGHWYGDAGQPRLGGRIAVGAEIATTAGPIVFVSTHLESACDAAHRAAQVAAIIAALDTHFPDRPVLMGGDLNTGNHIGGDWRDETLFDLARAAGFEVHGGPETQPTTRPSLITRFPERAMKLDWFFSRGLRLGETLIHSSLDANGRPLSDHDRVETTIEALL
ncbi:endonuclease/exonuclease/phosphatase family metal-dependent hydrolase [Rhodobacter aestuarii]|uniref:Metal-dependent hydrolase, endonuclease/exonuclease/phosphatase family n=1 Tax=Rhodobacter aestuarii TaxID=453582 RepID=A0A1N7IYU6_9RHOB|nr:endonuclease/exonuclease/phosphatase family protein [Rhodobacter aestuarii]PTV97382.1 endonuclease/exonuclease/phosphatase family metal-dependent hydrolase [Rhodobacter aestuarii]SIS42166.1 Metal-dependent hydrolase, endonuclease/exonuclease/phosphatase family [Rhodobacter aestuarii]